MWPPPPLLLSHFAAFWAGQAELASALPVLGALAFGAQRLLPALQQAYGAWATIAGSQAARVVGAPRG